MKITVIGASGTIGSRLAERLAAAGHAVRAVSRTPGASAEGVETVAADLVDANQALQALAGSDAVYLTPPSGGEDPSGLETAVTTNVIDAAAREGVEHVVLHTAVHADRGDTGSEILDNKTAIERRLQESGVGWTILRPAWFLQNLWAPRDYLEQGVVSMPWDGDMTWAATDINDIVTVAAMFLEQGPTKEAFDVHIPGGITGVEVAEAASRVLGRPVTYQQAPASTREFVDVFPIAEAHKDLYAELFDYFKATTYLGDPEPISTALDGFEPRSVEDFLRDELFAS